MTFCLSLLQYSEKLNFTAPMTSCQGSTFLYWILLICELWEDKINQGNQLFLPGLAVVL